MVEYIREVEKEIDAASTTKKIEEYKRLVILTDGTTIPIDEMVAIERTIFGTFNDQ